MTILHAHSVDIAVGYFYLPWGMIRHVNADGEPATAWHVDPDSGARPRGEEDPAPPFR